MGLRWEWVLAAFAFSGCSDEGAGGRDCTDDFRYGIRVVVTGGAAVACEFDVQITEGSYTETIPCLHDGSDCECIGAGERPGTYALEVTSATETLHSSTVAVPDDGCHPEQQVVVVDAPAPAEAAEECTALGTSCDDENSCPPGFACQGMPTGSVCAPPNNGRETTPGGSDCTIAQCPDEYPECLVYASPGIGFCLTPKERSCACDRDVDRGTFVCE